MAAFTALRVWVQQPRDNVFGIRTRTYRSWQECN